MNSGIFPAPKLGSPGAPAVNRPAITMHSLVMHWLAKVTSQRVVTHDGYMAYGRYVRDPEQIRDFPALGQVLNGLIKLHGDNAPAAAGKLLSYLVQQNVRPVNVGRQLAIARTALQFGTNSIALELILLVKAHDAGRPAI